MQVLVVDDSPIDRMVLAAAVTRLGHECVTVTDGAAAMDVLAERHIDAVLTDWLMPGISGPELCQEIRASPASQYVYLVVLTASDRRDRGLQAVRAGADQFLLKPFDLIAIEMCLISAERVTAMQRKLLQQQAVVDELNAVLERQVRTDPLTGLGNRQRLDEDLEALRQHVARYGADASLVMCDLDRFKAYNDRFGHMAGDAALRQVARIFETTSRETDGVYRYGGEEMLVLLPNQDTEHATTAVERLRATVEQAQISHPDNHPFGVVTVSFGIAEVGAGPPTDSIERADAALYAAKSGGRNRWAVAARLPDHRDDTSPS